MFRHNSNEDGLRTWKSGGWALPGTPATINEYEWGPGGLLWSSNPNTIFVPGIGRRSNGAYLYFHPDWLESTRYTSDSTGTVQSGLRYEGFGNRTALSPLTNFHPTDFQWAGGFGYQTETAFSNEPGLGLDYLEQRCYDPAVGRWRATTPRRR